MDLVTIAPIALLIGALVLGEALVNRIRRLRRSPEERELFERAERSSLAADAPSAGVRGCANCKQTAITLPFQDGASRKYCSEECLLWGALGPTSFCKQCNGASMPNVSAGDMNQVNGIGRAFGGSWGRCRQCRSVLRRVWFHVLHIPLVPLGTYRVIHESPHRFRSQKLRSA